MDGVLEQLQERSTLLLGILAGVLGVGLIISLSVNVMQSQRQAQERKLLQGEITDLRYQVNLDQQTASAANPSPTPQATPSPSPTPEASPSPTPEASPAVMGAQDQPAVATATVINGGVKLRAAASTTSKQLAWLPAGTTVTLGSFKNATWQEVTANGQHGYVSWPRYLKY